MILYTIGYSAYERELFVNVLQEKKIRWVIDVRSVPASGYRPEYDKAAIDKYLAAHGIGYRHMPREFGARQEKRAYLAPEGYVDFGLFVKSEAFGEGVRSVEAMAERGELCALMCAEKDALTCHRSILISREFARRGWTVIHLSPDGEETHKALEGRLLNLFFPNRFQMSLLEAPRDDAELLDEAYRLQNQKIGFRKEA